VLRSLVTIITVLSPYKTQAHKAENRIITKCTRTQISGSHKCLNASRSDEDGDGKNAYGLKTFNSRSTDVK